MAVLNITDRPTSTIASHAPVLPKLSNHEAFIATSFRAQPIVVSAFIRRADLAQNQT